MSVKRYAVPILLDGDNQPIGLFTLHTDHGSVLLLFEDETYLRVFSQRATEVVETEGRGVGYVYMEATSPEEIQLKLVKVDPTLNGEFQVLSEDDVLFHNVLAALFEV